MSVFPMVSNEASKMFQLERIYNEIRRERFLLATGAQC